VGCANLGGIAGHRGHLQCGSLWNSPIIATKLDSLNVSSKLFVLRSTSLVLLCYMHRQHKVSLILAARRGAIAKKIRR